MRLGIIGLSQSGKTTIFNALTRGDCPLAMNGGRFEVHTSVVDVPDPRVDQLASMFHPKKTTYAKVTYADIAGLEGSANGNISGPLLNQLTQMDGFIHVVRCFDDSTVPHPAGSVDPERDLTSMEAEFVLNDLIVVERKLERLAEESRRGARRDQAAIQREVDVFESIRAALEDETPLREVALSPGEESVLAGYGFLSIKPILIVLNLSDGQTPPKVDFCCNGIVSLQGKLEMEIAQLPPDDADVFLSEFDIAEPSLNLMIRQSYDLLKLQSFFTVGADEVRAWTVRREATARESAGMIHSDLEKGFIRAEVVGYDDLVMLGKMSEARAKGKLRLEGKDYIVQDGEIMHVRFNV